MISNDYGLATHNHGVVRLHVLECDMKLLPMHTEGDVRPSPQLQENELIK